MRYRVTAEQRKGWPGRWRSGRHFVAGQWVELDEAEVTDAMRADPVLIIEPLPEPDAKESETEEPEAKESEAEEAEEPAPKTPRKRGGRSAK